MGKGLGNLQRAILLVAYEKYMRNSAAYVSAREILIGYYGFPTNGKPLNRYSSSLVFDRRVIGFRRYMSASVTIVQCFNRLMVRGFVERDVGHGIRLTRAGAKQARELCAVDSIVLTDVFNVIHN